MSTTRRRAWIWYAAVWIPLAFFHAVALMQQTSIPTMFRGRPLTFPQALRSGVDYVLPVALLGACIWKLTGRISWPPKSVPRFVLLHLAAAFVFAGLWLASEVALIGVQTSFDFALQVSQTFRGFQVLDGVFVYGLIAAASHVIRISSRLREEEARATRADALRVRAELAALRGQLNPHFLFNTLHTLTTLVRRDPATAEAALERFGDMLRYVLDVKRSAREDVTLGDELEFVRTYLALEQLRLGDRLRMTERIDPDALDCVLPSLTLQPLVENAIKYGIAPRARGGSLEITASVDEESLKLEVRDDGPGASRDVMNGASGVGLRAVRQRLETRYGEAASFDVTTAPGEGFVVGIRLPAVA